MDRIPIRPDGLQLDECRRFQERAWTAERLAWCGFALIVAVALLGLTGAGGPWSGDSRRIGSATVEYPAVARWASPDVLRVHLAGPDARTLTLSPAFLDAFEIETIRPDPETSTLAPDGLRLTFAVDGRSSAPITFTMRPMSVGRVSYRIAVAGQAVDLTTFVLP